MSVASSKIELYKLRKYVEDAAKTILEGLSLNVLVQRSLDTETTPVVAVQFTGGQSLPDVTPAKASGALAPGPWQGTLEFAVKTSREENDDKHEEYVAKIRKEMHEREVRDRWNNEQAFEESELPHHEIQQIVEQSETPTVDEGGFFDITRISYSMIVSIRSNAWP